MRAFLGTLIMLAGVYGICYFIHIEPPDTWMAFPAIVTFAAIELAGMTIAGFWDYF